MNTLSGTHPQAQHYLHAGEFAVQRSQDFSFSQVPVDHTIEQTVNKDTKTKGSIIGFSLNKGAVQRWTLTAHERAAILRNFKNMLDSTEDLETTLKEARSPQTECDENDVIKVAELVENWGNPCGQSEELSSLSSGSQTTFCNRR